MTAGPFRMVEGDSDAACVDGVCLVPIEAPVTPVTPVVRPDAAQPPGTSPTR